jgi:hypothetical protein
MNIVKKISFLLFTLAVLFACKKESPIDTVAVNGALSGEFSVSKTKKVHFSQGNLKHPDNHTWSFATNQWENGDLFEWSHHAKDSSFIDWGYHPITNGGDQHNQWRTLTMNEWMYLFHGRANAGYLFGFGKVNGVKGLIILPDNGNGASDFHSALNKGFEWKYNEWIDRDSVVHRRYYYYTTKDDKYSHNTFKGKKWHEMELKGAVFLPVVDDCVSYWSASRDITSGPTDSYILDFYGHYLWPMASGPWYYRFSVRLVQ